MLPTSFHSRMLAVSALIVFIWLILVYFVALPFYAGGILLGTILGLTSRSYSPALKLAPIYAVIYTLLSSQIAFVLLEFQIVNSEVGRPWYSLFTHNFIWQFVDENMDILSAEKIGTLFASGIAGFIFSKFGKAKL